MPTIEVDNHVEEHSIRRIVLGEWKNAERPLLAVYLLDAASHWLEKNSALVDGKQPFMVRDIVVDTHAGTITLYLANND